MKRKVVLSVVLISLACLVVVGARMAGWLWSTVRPQPAEKNQTLFEGITYLRDTRQSPRSMVIHVVKVNLRQKRLSFLVTPGDPEADLPVKARTTSQFLQDYGLQLAINGDGFTPWHTNNLLDYYPHPGDLVDPVGFAASKGQIYSQNPGNEPILYIARDNRARFNSPLGGIYNAVSGNAMLVEDGKVLKGLDDSVQPRTAIALDERRRQLIIVLVDGRQPNYSEGITLDELAKLIVEFGGYTAMNLDGGGSTTLVIEDSNGKAKVLNSPIDQYIPGRERTIGSHLGIYASRE
jgi:hypothetical protein